MAKSRSTAKSDDGAGNAEAPSLRERAELILFIAVQVLCLLLFMDFLFFGFYIK